MSERRVEAFFYGLYMDIDVLREAGVAPLAPRKAYVDGFALRIGRRATLLPSAGTRAYGMLYTVTHTISSASTPPRASSTIAPRR